MNTFNNFGFSPQHITINYTRMKNHQSAKPLVHTAYLAYYANAHAWKSATPHVVALPFNIAHGPLGGGGGGGGGWVIKLYACALFIIDGLGHATWSLTMPIS